MVPDTENDYFTRKENPFLLDITDKDEYTIEEYIDIQEKLELRNKLIDPFLDTLYPKWGMRTTLEEIKRRCTKGLNAKIIDTINPVLPEKKLHKIGDGGDKKRCFVCCTPLLDNRCEYSKSIIQSLEEVGFNGHFLILNGGFPNPTGTEMKYVGVPYSFKIFMMLEAQKLGFDKVIWIDAACYAVNNVDRLFDMLGEYDTVFRAFYPNVFAPDCCINNCFPKTVELLNSIVNQDVRSDTNINSIVFGLNLSSEKMKSFIEEYYEMVKSGLPFLTSFPEEIVFSSLMNKKKYKYVFDSMPKMKTLYVNEYDMPREVAKSVGYYFTQRHYTA